MKFQFSDYRRVKGLKPDAVAGELQRIYEADGALRASRVVEESTPKTAVLHPVFEWRDKVAAAEYRLEQARRLVRVVRVVDEDGEGKSSPAFVHVAAVSHYTEDGEREESREGAYHPVSVVVENIDMFQNALTQLEQRMRSAMAAVDALKRAAQSSTDADRLARVALAVRALETASEAISSLH